MYTMETEKIGLILISPIECCIVCGSKLSVRQDRSVQAIIYDDYYGTFPAFTSTDTAERKAAEYSNTMAITQKEIAVR